MRLFFDTNVLSSAILTTEGVCSRLIELSASPNEPMTSSYCVEELINKLRTKFAKRPEMALSAVRLVAHLKVERSIAGQPGSVRDPKDEAVLASAVAASADLLVIGDRDLLDVVDPPLRIVSPAGALPILGG